MSDSTDVIKEFEVSKRINEASTSFNVTFNTPLNPAEYKTGSTFEFVITDNTLTTGFTTITGIIESVERDNKDNNRIYKITGRDKGRLLVKQPYGLDCNTETPTTYTVMQLLTLILADTGITVGRGQEPLSETITLTTDGTSKDRFCGSWTSKQDAINQLFNQYQRLSEASDFRWWVDSGGYFRWFELNTTRGGQQYIFNDDNRVLNFTVKEDATAIINSHTGYYGQEEDQTSVTITNTSSISTYGLCPAQTITETEMTQTEITTKLQRNCDQQSIPIYSATLELDGYYDIEPGQQIIFPDDPYYSTKTFTVTDRSYKGSPNSTRTTLNLTTDESAISITNEFEVIQATAKKEVQDNKAEVAIVSSVPTDGSERFTALSTSSGGKEVSVRNPGGGFTLGGLS
jgi:hypothetical protein